MQQITKYLLSEGSVKDVALFLKTSLYDLFWNENVGKRLILQLLYIA